jgi:hypothetical protein
MIEEENERKYFRNLIDDLLLNDDEFQEKQESSFSSIEQNSLEIDSPSEIISKQELSNK